MVVAGIVLLVVGALLAVANWAIVVEVHRTKKHSSLVGPLGGVAMLGGALMLGWRWGMLLALADPGVLMVMYLPVFLVIEARRSRQRKRTGD